MTIKLPSNVVTFASGNTDLYINYLDYINHWKYENGDTTKFSFVKTDEAGKTLTLKDKEDRLNVMLISEVEKMSGISFSAVSAEQLMSHPTVCWALGNIASMMIDAVLPQTLIESTSAYAEVKTIGYGETQVFDIKSRRLFYVTRSGRGMKQAQMQKGFENQATLYPEARMITVGVNLFRVLSNQESLAEFTVKAMRSIETEMRKDIYNAWVTATAGLSTDATTGLAVSGYTQQDMMRIAQRVSAFNGGAKPIVIGTKVALSQVLPDDTNTRADYTSEYVKLGYLRTVGGLDLYEIPQVADWTNEFATVISDDYLWIIAPGVDKPIKVVIGGATITSVDSTFQNANLAQTATMQKAWDIGVITSAVAGMISL